MKATSLSGLLRPVGAWAIVALFLIQLVVSIPQLLGGLQPILEDPNRSNDDKLHIQWPGYYDLMHFIAERTPENAAILMDNSARVKLDLYFLYPRRLLYGGAETFRTHPEIEYVVATEDFPDFPVTGEKQMMNDKFGLYKIQR
jgi:hypothetical protein